MSQSLEKQVDHDLIERCQRSDEEAFALLVRRHQARLFHIAQRMVRDRDQAADLVQETFLRAYKNIGKYKPTGSVSGWLARIVTNLSINYLEKRKRLSFPELSLARWLPAGPGSDPTHKAELSDMRATLRKEVTQLSPRRQAVLTLAMLGYNYDEMSEILGEKVSQVKSELFRARRKLKECLKSQEPGKGGKS